MAFSMFLPLMLVAVITTILTSCISARNYSVFTGVVYEHARLGIIDTHTPADIIRRNLNYYKTAAQDAGMQFADIIVYPEYGIFPPSDRMTLKNFLENIPDPKHMRTTPCDEFETYSDRPILYALSCMAKENFIHVVANTGDIQPCKGQPDCPEDGAFHYNTNLAFDRQGTLIAKYYKEHLFFDLGMDIPREEQDPIVETDFGTFAMFIGFDILHEKMSKVARMPEVDGILLSSMWLNVSPLYTSVQLFQSWAKGHDATLLASNTQIPGLSSFGSGIFEGLKGAVTYSFNPDGNSKLHINFVYKSHRLKSSTKVSLIPSVKTVLENDTDHYDQKCCPAISEQCSYKLLGNSTDIHHDFRCFEITTQNYTLVKLTNPRGRVEACNNGMCCSLKYRARRMDDTFYLGVYNGTHNAFNRYFWEEENCFLARCDDLNGVPCATFPARSNTFFLEAKLTANFSTEYIYPSVVESKMQIMPEWYWKTIPNLFRKNKRTIDFESSTGRRLLVAAFNARAYHRDHSYGK